MRKLITLIAVVGLVAFTTPAFSGQGGEGNNTGCNGQGNTNSPCAGQGGSGGNGGNGGNGGKGGSVDSSIVNKINNKVNNTIKNKVSNSANSNQSQSASADNEGVTIGGSTYEDNSVYIAPPSTTPMVGTTSAQITTPFGGVGFSKDAKHAKLMTTIQFIDFMKKNEIIDESRAKEDTLKVYDKLLRTVCGSYCATDDVEEDEKETEGNGGNL